MSPEIVQTYGPERVYVVEEHHHVLLPWARMRAELPCAPYVLTLDHHTDTLPAFTHWMERGPVREPVFCWRGADEALLRTALHCLRHDEHFDFALRSDLIAGAVLVTHEDFSTEHDERLRIVHLEPDCGLRAWYGRALESGFLAEHLARSPILFDPDGPPYLLDVDLDYFKTARSVNPADGELFDRLARGAYAVTVSRERDWVRLLNREFDRAVDWKTLEASLLARILNVRRGS